MGWRETAESGVTMADYILFTDSSCDIGLKTLAEWGVKTECLTFKFDDSDTEYISMFGEPGQKVQGCEVMPAREFYDRMRSGGVARTSAVNMQTFYDAFKEELDKGNDILFIGMSTGISNTSNAASIAADELKSEYPDRKIITIDTLTASVGQGLLLYDAVMMKRDGKDIDEVAGYVMANLLRMNLWVTVEDLSYLKRGGRISATAAFAGGVLQLKPVIHLDNEGKLENMMKVRGRSQSIKALEKLYTERATDKKGRYMICQADCLEDAKTLENMIYEKHGAEAVMITDMSPVIGAHTGPGAIVLVFYGDER